MAGRRQHRQRERLPKYVYLAKGRYIFVPFQGGRRGKEVVLCRDGAALKEVWTAYEAITRPDATGTLRWLSDQYLASPAFQSKQHKTQRDYRRCHETAMQVLLKDGSLFGQALLEDVTPGVIAAYRDRRTQDGPIAANRELAYLSLIFSWGFERELVKANPVKGLSGTASAHASATSRIGSTSSSTTWPRPRTTSAPRWSWRTCAGYVRSRCWA